MKDTATDYFTQLRSDFIPKKKDKYDNSRRPFNPGDPGEFLFAPPPLPDADKTNTKSVFRTNTTSAADLFSQLPDTANS